MKIVIKHPKSHTTITSDEVLVSPEELGSVPDGSCISVHLSDCMDYFPDSDRNNIFNEAAKKVRVGGEFTVSGTDILTTAQHIENDLVSIHQANVALFNYKMSADTINHVVQKVRDINFELINCKLDGLYYSIKAKRSNG